MACAMVKVGAWAQPLACPKNDLPTTIRHDPLPSMGFPWGARVNEVPHSGNSKTVS